MNVRYGLALGLTLALIGCGVSNNVPTADMASELSPEQLAGTTLVVLKVPNMT